MINLLIAFFYFLEELGLLQIEDIIVNIQTLLICRGVFSASYYLNYLWDKGNNTDGRKTLLTKKETIYFILKQAMLVLFGSINLVFTLFIGFYSLAMAGKYLSNNEKKRNNKMSSIIGKLLIYLPHPIGILGYGFLNPNLHATAAIGLSAIAFYSYGLKVSSLSLTELIDKYNKRRIEKIPKIIQYILLIFLIW